MRLWKRSLFSEAFISQFAPASCPPFFPFNCILLHGRKTLVIARDAFLIPREKSLRGPGQDFTARNLHLPGTIIIAAACVHGAFPIRALFHYHKFEINAGVGKKSREMTPEVEKSRIRADADNASGDTNYTDYYVKRSDNATNLSSFLW